MMSNVPGAFGKHVKCPCCKNPWNQEDSSGGSAAGAILCTPCLSDDKGFKGINPVNFDQSVNLKDNFYYWSNGGWMRENPIPLEYSSWNTFIVLRDLNLDRLKTILDELASVSTEKTAKLADYYSSFMDEENINAKGISVLAGLLNDCNECNSFQVRLGRHVYCILMYSYELIFCQNMNIGGYYKDDCQIAQEVRSSSFLCRALESRQK